MVPSTLSFEPEIDAKRLDFQCIGKKTTLYSIHTQLIKISGKSSINMNSRISVLVSKK